MSTTSRWTRWRRTPRSPPRSHGCREAQARLHQRRQALCPEGARPAGARRGVRGGARHPCDGRSSAQARSPAPMPGCAPPSGSIRCRRALRRRHGAQSAAREGDRDDDGVGRQRFSEQDHDVDRSFVDHRTDDITQWLQRRAGDRMTDLEQVIDQPLGMTRDTIGLLHRRRGPPARWSRALGLLDRGEARVAEPDGNGGWRVNQWLKKAVLLSFRLNDNVADRRTGRGPDTWFDKVPSKFSQLERCGVSRRGVPRGARARSSAAARSSVGAQC